MTTPPKGRKFRIRRGFGNSDGEAGSARASFGTSTDRSAGAQEDAPASQAETESPEPRDEATQRPERRKKERVEGTPQTPPEPPAQTADDEAEIAAIKEEGLTARQLRMARRTALKHGLTAVSDYDAVRQLRGRGIDPFARSNMLELIVSEEDKAKTATATLPASRPTTEPDTPRAPSDELDANTRASEIYRVQQEIARRRQRRLALLFTRLAFFVALPTMVAAYYFYAIATPLYATSTEFVIQKADAGGGGANPLSGFFGGTSFGTVQESIAVQSFLESREAMLRLDEELGFREHFSAPDIDPLIRLAPDATDEAMFDVYRQNLQIGYDPTEGLIRMEIRAADPATSQAYSEALLEYAEERVDHMSQRVRADQMTGAFDSYAEAEQQLVAAQQRVLELQEQRGVLSTEAEVSTVFQQISTFELQLQEERLRLLEMLSVDRPNQTRVDVAEQNIQALEDIIADLRGGLTDESGEEVSLARISSELVVAQADMETRQMILTQALQQMETARIEANRQSLYLSVSVFPVQPDEAAYPKAFENTLLTLLVFAGIYLMLSMTASILREQVSA